MALAPPDRRDHPRVVLLTPGPHNETYFEHAYLARYLGFTLVEGGDLTVRDRRVFIKTLDGLQPVDVIFRRLDDSFCDPLELRADSTLGVAGLVEAVRAGHVTIANALGSGVVETPAMAAFLPELCRHLLGEELLLSPARSWWCGHPDELQYVLEHLDELVIKPAFPPADAAAGLRPDAQRRAERRAAKRAAGTSRGLRRAERSGAVHGAGLERPRSWSRVRSCSACTSPRPAIRSSVMPGGLTRVAAASDVPIVSMQRGGGSKDTWVMSDGPVSARLAAGADAPQRAARAPRRRPAEPRRRQSVLARPPRRAGGAHGAAAAQPRGVPDARGHDRGHAGARGAAARAGRPRAAPAAAARTRCRCATSSSSCRSCSSRTRTLPACARR